MNFRDLLALDEADIYLDAAGDAVSATIRPDDGTPGGTLRTIHLSEAPRSATELPTAMVVERVCTWLANRTEVLAVMAALGSNRDLRVGDAIDVADTQGEMAGTWIVTHAQRSPGGNLAGQAVWQALRSSGATRGDR